MLVSAFVFPGGRGEAALQRIIEGLDNLVLSKPILDELLGILARKFSRDAEELARIAVFLSTVATFVAGYESPKTIRTTECSNARSPVPRRRSSPVTRALLALHNFREVRLLRLRDYLEDRAAQPIRRRRR